MIQLFYMHPQFCLLHPVEAKYCGHCSELTSLWDYEPDMVGIKALQDLQGAVLTSLNS